MIHNEVKNYWDGNAATWFHLSEIGIDIWRDHVNTPAFINMLPDTRGLVGLDVGCGDAHNTRLIAERCKSLDAIDICETFIALNKQSNNPKNINYHLQNATKISFPNEHFDFVVATMSLMDMAELDKALQEIYRVLSPTGFFQFSIIHPCFNEFKGEWVKKDDKYVGLLTKDYFAKTDGAIHEWQHVKSPPGTPNFQVPRFLRPLSEWINLLLSTGFILEEIREPYASDQAIKEFPELASTKIVAHSLILRVRKNEQKEEPLRKIIEKLPGNVWWKDKDLKYLGCNDRVLQVLGLSRKEFVGKTDYQLWDAAIARKLEEADLHVLRTGEIINLEEVIVEVTGRKATMLTNKSPLQDSKGNIIGILGTSTDISTLKETQTQLREAEERLSAIRSLSASIAHELRTPLSAMQFCVRGTKNYLPSLVEAYKIAKENNLEVKPIQSNHLQVLSNVLNSIESEIKYSETIINMILMNVKQSIAPAADFKKYSVNTCIEEAMHRYPFKKGEKYLVTWTRRGDFIFTGDKTLMVHVLFNLMKNAFYYIEAAKKGAIRIWCENAADKNLLFFKDTSMGISEEELPKLFERFYTTTHHGTGLGLSFCKTVMNLFGGDIICKSENGKFTQFEMSFPKIRE